MRIFSVTGNFTALTVASRIFAAWTSSRISDEPAWPFTTFFTGSRLMSMIGAPRSSFSLAASAMTSGSQPASWTDIGNSSGEFLAISSVLRFSRTIAAEAIISDTTSQPRPLHHLAERHVGHARHGSQDDGVVDPDRTDVEGQQTL